jgi:hypothetical protein
LLFCGLGFLVSDDVFAYTGARFHGLGKVTRFRKVTLAYCAHEVSATEVSILSSAAWANIRMD